MSEIEPLGPAAIDRVYDANSAKILGIPRIPVVEESRGFTYDWHYTNPVPVFNDEGKRLGHATLYRESGEEPRILMADLFLDYASPERLTIELEDVHLYACPDGRLDLEYSPASGLGFGVLSETPLRVKASVWGLWIATTPPKSVSRLYRQWLTIR